MEEEDKNLSQTLANSSSDWILDHDFMVTILIPSLLLLILLLLAITIACILYRKRSQMMMKKPDTRILSPRAPVIFASELGRYSDNGMMHKRLFSDDEDDNYAPEDVDIGGRKQDGTGDINQGSDGRTLPRQVPPYWDRRGR
jgi:hypothetical protein